MENNENVFQYTYSAKERSEVASIRQKYLPREENKMDLLRKLDHSVTQKAQVWALTLGIIGTLIQAGELEFEPDDDDEEIYRVQTGLFRNKENADAMANKLRSMGYPVAIEMFNDLYAVKVGEYDDLEDATELERKLRHMGYDTLIVSR